MAKLISGWVSDLLSGQPGDAAGRKAASGNDGSNHYGGIMTFTWIVIAVLFVVGLYAYSARKKRNAMNDAESKQTRHRAPSSRSPTRAATVNTVQVVRSYGRCQTPKRSSPI